MKVAATRAGKPRLTPVMEQFFRAKDQVPDAILFFRMGDFYEMFFEDAVEASELLDITLTSRSKSADGERIPMAGVPHHAAAGYVARLLEQGRKVAICEQMADPSQVKGVVPREIVRVVTPGLCVETDALHAETNNYLAAIEPAPEGWGLAAFDLSTGELLATDVANGAELLAELVRLDPRELLIPMADRAATTDGAALLPSLSTILKRVRVEETETAHSPADLETWLEASEAQRVRQVFSPRAQGAVASLLAYAAKHQVSGRLAIQRIGAYDPSHQLGLDEAAVRNLELVRTIGGDRKGSVLHLLDCTHTAMGARRLRRWLLAPATEVSAIRRRQDRVEAFADDSRLRNAARECLRRIPDLERLASRALLGLATPRDLASIRDGLGAVHELAELLRALAETGALTAPLADLLPSDLCTDVHQALDASLAEEPPLTAHVGGIFREGFDPALDELVRLSTSSKDVILEVEQRERRETGIHSLKIRYTRVFGYYIEVTKANIGAVPDRYRRKQTLAGAERYTTSELTDLEAKVLNAEERRKALESELFATLRAEVAGRASVLGQVASAVAAVDVFAALAEVAERHGYVRPTVDDSTGFVLVEARHPIVERLAAAGDFVPNDVALDTAGEFMMMITGPNMAGKSTVMRQVALIVILAQVGSFVPAKSARIGIVDRIYTRVGASDNLAQGQSTFMVEMQEAATILRGATPRSLVILDEIGRGTSTYDGLAIAWAVAEHLHDSIGCRTLFATHYHELCELARTRKGVVNTNVAAKEFGEEMVFLRKLVPGGANRSYGVAVARLAGLPEIVLARARALLVDLERGAPLPSGAPAKLRGLDGGGRAQLDLFGQPVDSHAERPPSEVERTLAQLDIDRMRPVDALVALARLRDLLAGPNGANGLHAEAHPEDETDADAKAT